MTEIIIKGELHTSESDLDEERELLTHHFDALVLEGQREEAEYGLLRGWYFTAMSIVGLVFFKILYSDHRILIDLAKAQEAEIYNTRESNAELIENAHPIVEFVAAILFYGLFAVSIVYGLITGDTLGGALILALAALLPVLVLRYHEMIRTDDSINRDQLIANTIEDAAEESDRVVAVVGNDHVNGIVSQLHDHIDPEIREPSYGPYSWQHAKEIAVPAFTAISVMFFLYLIGSWKAGC